MRSSIGRALFPLVMMGGITLACSESPGGEGSSTSASSDDTGATSSSASADESGTNSTTSSESEADATSADATNSDTTSEESSETDESESGDDASTGPILDVGGEPLMGCEKVDFLFVIDNSVSMASHQEALIASFSGFIDAIKNTLNATSDYNIMVVDTDPGTRCTPEGCIDPNMWVSCLCVGPENGDACVSPYSECDSRRGAGVLEPRGRGASNQLCEVYGGNRYIVVDEPNLLDAFSCVAQVGEAGKANERPMDSMVAAVSAELNESGGCNEGFLRDDAILVVTIISDDPNYADTPGPQEWKDALVEAKNGDEGAIVVLGLLPEYLTCDVAAIDLCGIGLTPGPNPNSGLHWVEFVESFGEQGLWGLVCVDDYTPFFQEAVDIVDEVCDSFIPPD